jgi:hypothetical protein
MPMLTRADEEPDEEPDKEFRDNDMLDHVDFEAGRYDYDNDDDFDHEGIDFQLNQPEVTLSDFNSATRRLDAQRDFVVGTVQHA